VPGFCNQRTCYRYQRNLSDENAEIADCLLRLTQTYKRWGFGLCLIPEPIGNFPPTEYELLYYQQLEESSEAA